LKGGRLASPFHDGGAQALAQAIASGGLSALNELSIPTCRIGDTGLCALAAVFEKGVLPALHTLGLSENHFADPGVKALA
jgi:hypothetical protein